MSNRGEVLLWCWSKKLRVDIWELTFWELRGVDILRIDILSWELTFWGVDILGSWHYGKNPSILLEIWDLGGCHITSDMGLGLVNVQVPSFSALTIEVPSWKLTLARKIIFSLRTEYPISVRGLGALTTRWRSSATLPFFNHPWFTPVLERPYKCTN